MPSRILRLWNPDASAWEEVGDSRLTAHLAAADPHPTYLTASEGDALFLTQSEGDARYAPIGGGGGGGDYLPLTGGTLTGTLTAPAVAAGAFPPGTASRAYGASTPAFTPTTGASFTGELGLRFRTPATGLLTGVRWYRVAAGSPTPAAVKLWDTTTGSPAVHTLSGAPLAPFADTAVGWKTATYPTPPTLVAGRDYILSLPVSAQTFGTASSYTPVPDAPLVVVTNVFSSSVGSIPGTSSANAYLLDPAVTPAAGTLAASGAVRLPNDATGAIAWRNAGNTADLPLTVTASNALTFNGSALLTQAVADPLYLSPTEGDAAYLKLTGGTLTGNLGVGGTRPVLEARTAGAQSSARFGQFSPGALAYYTANALFDGSNWLLDDTTQPGAALNIGTPGANALEVTIFPAGANPATGRAKTPLKIAPTGTVSLTPDAGQACLSLTPSAGGAALSATTHIGIQMPGSGNTVYPVAHNSYNLGSPTNAWGTVYATTGTIQPSLAAAKQDITPLAPEDALAAVRATDPIVFDYTPPDRGPEWYELPDDPEQAAQVLEQRLTAAPLEEGARHQAGFVLADETGQYHTDPLFETGEGQSNSANTAGILLAALKALDTRLTTLEQGA